MFRKIIEIFFLNFLFSSPVTLNVFTYNVDSYVEGTYDKVDDIPPVSLESTTPTTSMRCRFI